MKTRKSQTRIARSIRRTVLLTACCPIMLSSAGAADEATAKEPATLANLSFEQLSQIQVITASKREQTVENVPAAVDVVTQNDIQRSGATSIPEALRNVPGLNVAQINSSTWAIGARGFPWQYAPRLLVLMDGRSVYTPTFGGVNWDVQDYLLEDLDRIEVVLGPGSTVWGAQGTLVSAGGGSEKLAMAGAREGFKLSDEVFGRVYGKYKYDNATLLHDGSSADDAFQFGQAGYRLDGYPGEHGHWTLQGDAYGGWEQSHLNLPDVAAPPAYATAHNQADRVSGANMLGRW
ncbi:MAG: TonB-dependent receptor plug domain-containing protein, partial [Verrucomicrobia bacterium]|nr:TonB-dependent receptor plug domain-containing protein [Verrucomicrobiota bacterium]